jgi:5'-3' exonuclease
MRLLIDGDILVYRCAFAAESTRYTLLDEESGMVIGQFDSAKEYKEYAKEHELEGYEVETERLYGPLPHALSNVKTTVEHILSKMKSDDYVIVLSDGAGFRSDIATIKKYKGNRDDSPRPKWYEETRQFLVDNYGALVYSSVEADDVLALCQNEGTCIVSIDKDLLQVPGRHYNWVRDERVIIRPETGLRLLYQQVLTGDGTDNIPGIRGVGPVRAERILADVEPTKKALSDVCTAEWEKYLRSEQAHEDGFRMHSPEEGEEYVYYTPWCSDTELATTPESIAAEIFQLVLVGGDYAKAALDEAGESLP